MVLAGRHAPGQDYIPDGFSELVKPWRLAKRKIPERNTLMRANVVDDGLCSFAIASRSFSPSTVLKSRSIIWQRGSRQRFPMFRYPWNVLIRVCSWTNGR